ncbi:hypothetical protein BSKO_07391 [Bryopsis sp. KO-2023]|nr:hypothetical protein BSKO_07391 [Bryopsis sp. KO-2023]
MEGGATRAHTRPVFLQLRSSGVKFHSRRVEACRHEHGTVEGEAASRRALLSLSCGLIASSCFSGKVLADEALVVGPPDTEPDSRPEISPTKDFSADGLFSFSYPKRWLVAYDRTNRDFNGSLVLAGDFVNVDTFTVSRRVETDFVDDNGSLLSPSAIADKIISEARDTPSAMSYELFSEGERKREDGYPYYVVEYAVEVCRGQVEELIGGNKICSGPNDLVLQTVKRRHILGVTRKGDKVFIVSGAALQSRWGSVGNDVLAAFDSFALD